MPVQSAPLGKGNASGAAFRGVLDEVADTAPRPLKIGHAVRPPALFIGLGQREADRKPDHRMVMDAAGLVLLSDPQVAKRDAPPVKVFADGAEQGRDVIRPPHGILPIGERQKRSTEPPPIGTDRRGQQIAHARQRLEHPKGPPLMVDQPALFEPRQARVTCF